MVTTTSLLISALVLVPGIGIGPGLPLVPVAPRPPQLPRSVHVPPSESLVYLLMASILLLVYAKKALPCRLAQVHSAIVAISKYVLNVIPNYFIKFQPTFIP